MKKFFINALMLLAAVPLVQCNDDDSPNDYFKLAVDGMPVKVVNPTGVLSLTEEDGFTGRELTINGFAEGQSITVKISNWTNRTSAEGGVATVSYIVDKHTATTAWECVEVDGGKLCDDMLITYRADGDAFFSYLGTEGFGMITECHDRKISGCL